MLKLILAIAFLTCCLASHPKVCISPKNINSLPRGWELLEKEKPDLNKPHRFTIALKHRNVDHLEKSLLSVSDPKSKDFGKFWSLEDIARHFGPTEDDVSAVQDWLVSQGVEGPFDLTAAGEFMRFYATLRNVEEIFNTKLGVFHHAPTGVKVIRAKGDYCIPFNLHHIIHFVDGLHGFPTKKYMPLHQDVSATLTPADLYKYYSVQEPNSSVKGNLQAPVQFGRNFHSPSDLQKFQNKYVPNISGEAVNNIYGDEGSFPISIEANLDVQYIMALGNHVPTDLYVQKCPNSDSIENCFIDYTLTVANQTSPPLVQTISYGDYGGNYNNDTVQRLNEEFMKMGLRGISIVLASGDNGVGCNSHCTSFEFDFPSSPHITMVGATYFELGTEKGATLSSGGFSADYYRPDYQAKLVDAYLNSDVSLPDEKKYVKQGRAYPDVSAAGVNLMIFARGSPTPVSGTSCSAPIFGGIISLINNERIKAGKSPMGFLNPWLYSNPEMFNDITSGNNKYCGNGCCCEGFNAHQGWDPVTGLGSPNYSKMLKSAMSLP